MNMQQESIPIPNKEEPSLPRFQEEMANFAHAEGTGEIESGHFLLSGFETRELDPDFDPSKLTEDDWAIWKKIKDGTITLEEFNAYRPSVVALDDKDPGRKSRMIFVEFAGNKAMNAIFEHVFPGKRKEPPHFHKA
jgi:hypothetical protein